MSKRARHMRKTCYAKRIKAEIKHLATTHVGLAKHLLKKIAVWRLKHGQKGWVSFGWQMRFVVKPDWVEEVVSLGHTEIVLGGPYDEIVQGE